MQSIPPTTESQGQTSENPYDFTADIPPEPPPSAEAKREFVMGSRQIASLAFVGVIILGGMSAVAYFAGRKNTEPQHVTERVIERVISAPPAVAAAAPPVAVAQAPVPIPVPVPVSEKPKPAEVPAAKPLSAPPVDVKTPVNLTSKVELTKPALNRLYLQAGSVEVGVAEVIVGGLRQLNLPASVGTGITPKVARILLGPFTSNEELHKAQVKIEALGFHPFPRVFTEKDLEQQAIIPVSPQPPPPQPLAQVPPPVKP